MQRNNMRLRVSIYLTTLIAVLVFASLFVGCRNPTTQNGNQTTAPSPSPTPTGSPSQELIPGDTIIVIKDGSVEIEVNKTLCTEQTHPTQQIFECAKIDLADVVIRNEKSKPPKPCPRATKLSHVSIDGGGGKDIDVQGHAAGGGHDAGVTITWKKDDYKPCLFNPNKFCGSNKVGKVKVDSTYTETCDPAEKCEIWIQK